MKILVKKLPLMPFDPHITWEVPCRDSVAPPMEPMEPMESMDRRARRSCRRRLWKPSKGNFFLILAVVFYFVSWPHFSKELRRLALDKALFMDHLGFSGEESISIYDDSSPATENDKKYG